MNENDVIELPPELEHKGRWVELVIDVVYINNEPFLHYVDRTIKLKLITTLQNSKTKAKGYDKESLFKGLVDILWYYNKADIVVTRIHAYNEFRTLMEELVDVWDVEIDFILPAEHVLDIERANQTLQ